MMIENVQTFNRLELKEKAEPDFGEIASRSHRNATFTKLKNTRAGLIFCESAGGFFRVRMTRESYTQID